MPTQLNTPAIESRREGPAVAFGDLADRLLTMKADNALALSGKLEVSAYTDKQGNPAAGLSVVCDELATLKARPKPKAEPAAPKQPVIAGFDDDLPNLG